MVLVSWEPLPFFSLVLSFLPVALWAFQVCRSFPLWTPFSWSAFIVPPRGQTFKLISHTPTHSFAFWQKPRLRWLTPSLREVVHAMRMKVGGESYLLWISFAIMAVKPFISISRIWQVEYSWTFHACGVLVACDYFFHLRPANFLSSFLMSRATGPRHVVALLKK